MSRVYVALDLETTGLSPERDAIIEIGAVRFKGDQVLDTWCSLVNPGRSLPYRIQHLTGITQAQLNSAPSLSEIRAPLVRLVGDAPVVGHNIPFDLGFLRRHGLLTANPAVDTFELASILVPYAARYSLGTLAEHLGINFPTRHRALDDARATMNLFLALLDRAANLDLKTIQEINRLAAHTDWPLKTVFRDIERDRSRTFYTGSIGQQLWAKGGLEDGGISLLLNQGDKVEPLRPLSRPEPVDANALVAMLETGGLLARAFPGYEYRPQQVEMLRAVVQAFNHGAHLLVEAGTGTGKSIAYLLPAVHYAAANNRRVVISTNTINLQDQLFAKDLPDLKKILPLDFRVALLKGRSNYLCRRRLEAMRHRTDLNVDEVRVLAKVLAWLPTTTSGDVAELNLMQQEQSVWARLAGDPETCQPETCAHADHCFFYRAHDRAAAAHVVVVNHALLLSDLALDGRALPEYQHLIVDEAHHLEARATEQMGFDVDQAQLAGLFNALSHPQRLDQPGGFLAEIAGAVRRHKVPEPARREVEKMIDALCDAVDRAQRQLHNLFNVLSRCLDELIERRGQPSTYDLQVRLTPGLRAQPAWSNVEIAWTDFSLPLDEVYGGLDRLYKRLSDIDTTVLANLDAWLVELAGYRRRVGELIVHLNAILCEPAADSIYWVSVDARDETISLHAAPLHVGPVLESKLFSQKECVVLTSATLRAGDGFDFVKERLGLWDVREHAVGSPFDYTRSTLLYLPTDIPEPGEAYYQKTLERALIELCTATRGRTLVLFTSHSQLQTTYKAISRPLGEAGIAVLGQGLDGSRSQLLETFKTDGGSVLLGTRSFWEGIDVVGEALSCLVIARLPFDVPNDPIFAARSEHFDEPFSQFAIPQAILRFRQGFGRLIRSQTDRGVVTVLDRRVMTKSYGRLFLEALPPCTMRRGVIGDLPAAAAQWLANSRQPSAVSGQ